MNEIATTRVAIPRGVDMALLVGPGNQIVHLIEDSFDARITVRGDSISITGSPSETDALAKLFSDLIDHILAGHPSDLNAVRSAIGLVKGGDAYENPFSDDVILEAHGRRVRPKTLGQKRYVDAIRSNTITFGIGPAGTGKTYLAMACAIAALKRHEVRKLVFTRPVVEAGENLGFLPGTLEEKIDPYIRPLFDALYDMLEREQAAALLEAGVIEVAPLAFMRGRTFNDSFLILDEAQNTTPEQMKLFLTRLGFRSKMVVTGDDTQLDLPRGISGLKGLQDILGEVNDIAFCRFGEVDVVRHSLVAQIVAAYAKAEQK